MKNLLQKLILLISMLFVTGVAGAVKVAEVIDVPKDQIWLVDSFLPEEYNWEINDFSDYKTVVIRFHINGNWTIVLPENYISNSFDPIFGYWKNSGNKIHYLKNRPGPGSFTYKTLENGITKTWLVQCNINFYGDVLLEGQKLKPIYIGDGLNTIKIQTEKDLDKILTVSKGLTNWWYLEKGDKYPKNIKFFEILDGVEIGESNQYCKTLRELLHEIRIKVPDYGRETTFLIEMFDGGGFLVEGVPKWEGFSAGSTIVKIRLIDSLPFPKYHCKVNTLGNGNGKVSFLGDSLVTWKEQISVTAEPDAVSEFLGWYIGEEKVSDELTYIFDMPYQDVQLTARFDKKSLWVTAEPSDPNLGSVKVRDQKVFYGESVVIEAIPHENAEFIGWKVLNGTKIFSTKKQFSISYFWPYVGDTSPPYGYSDKFFIAVFQQKVTGLNPVERNKNHPDSYVSLTGKKYLNYDSLPSGIYLYQGKKVIKQWVCKSWEFSLFAIHKDSRGFSFTVFFL